MKSIKELVKNNGYVSVRVETESIMNIVTDYINKMYNENIKLVSLFEDEEERLDFCLKNDRNMVDNNLYEKIHEDYEEISYLYREPVASQLGIEPDLIDIFWDGDSARLRLELPAEEYLKIKNNI